MNNDILSTLLHYSFSFVFFNIHKGNMMSNANWFLLVSGLGLTLIDFYVLNLKHSRFTNAVMWTLHVIASVLVGLFFFDLLIPGETDKPGSREVIFGLSLALGWLASFFVLVSLVLTQQNLNKKRKEGKLDGNKTS